MSNFLLYIYFTFFFTTDQKRAFEETINSKECTATDIDFLDAYKLKIGETFLYSKYDEFIVKMGLPSKVTVSNTDYEIHSKTDLDKAMAKASEVIFHYPGIDMWYVYENDIIPFSIDFRKTDKILSYGSTIFDSSYSIEKFKKEFPNSANQSFKLPQSFFETTTQEKGENFKHYLLFRKTKDNPDATPMIEFTFDKDKLIYILFANF